MAKDSGAAPPSNEGVVLLPPGDADETQAIPFVAISKVGLAPPTSNFVKERPRTLTNIFGCIKPLRKAWLASSATNKMPKSELERVPFSVC